MRDRLFSAVRSVVEAVSHRRPLVLAIEDIHWADEGMLDLIEYLARWVRGPLLLVCLARDELLERRPGWGGGRRNATVDLARAADRRRGAGARHGAVPRAATGTATASGSWSPRSPSAPAATRCSPRRWSTGCARRARADADTLPETVHSRARRTPRLARPLRAPRAPARLGRRPDLLGGLAELARRRGGPRPRRRARLAPGEGPRRPQRRQPARRASTSTPSSTP